MSDCSTHAMEPQVPPRKCCRAGTFGCEVPVLYPLGRNRLIYVDRCLAPELQSLWVRGVETAGCCCGHFEKDGFIQVIPEHVATMRSLGYEERQPVEIDGRLMGENAFKPKTVLEFGGYVEIVSELEQRCQQLEQVVRDMWSNYVRHYELSAFGGCDLSDMRAQLGALGVSLDD